MSFLLESERVLLQAFDLTRAKLPDGSLMV
jgi:hypothetical protein